VDETEHREGPGDGAERPSPPWVWAALVAFALVAVTAGAIVGMVATDGQGTPAAAVASGTGETDASPTAVLPPTVPIPAATGIQETGAFDTGPIATSPIDTIPTETTVAPPSGLTVWPAGTSGFTVILSSTPVAQGDSIPNSRAQQAMTAGLPSVGILDSSDFGSLRPGFVVVFSGVYTTLQQAQNAVPQARAAGFPSAYSRTVAP
jgi:hypothetical protein